MVRFVIQYVYSNWYKVFKELSSFMIRYEILLLAIPEITQDEAQRVETQLGQTIRSNQGSIISFERWGKYKLAYSIGKNDYGVYFLLRFEVEGAEAIVKDIQTMLRVKFSDIIMRNMAVKLSSKQSLEYQRPQSLEEMPAREVGSFFDRPGRPSAGKGRSRMGRDEYRADEMSDVSVTLDEVGHADIEMNQELHND